MRERPRVQHLFHPPALLTAWPEGDPRTSRLVFITRDLPRDVIEEGLRTLVAVRSRDERGRCNRDGVRRVGGQLSGLKLTPPASVLLRRDRDRRE